MRENIHTRSSPPRTSLSTLVSEATIPVPTFLITSKTANMSLRCGRWVQIIFAWGLGLVQWENLNKGRATGPCVTVDKDEEAMPCRWLLPLLAQVRMGYGPSVWWQSNHRAIV